jgi:threonine/homoserine/homoserine lactone efflux protein
VFSYVLGSITGPGIWYSTTVASPRGISALIHSFVWKWATEWVFFVIEVVGVYMLVYLAGKIDRRRTCASRSSSASPPTPPCW